MSSQDALPPHALARFGDLRWRTGGLFHEFSLSPSERYAAAASGGALYLWERATGRPLLGPSLGVVPEGKVQRATLLDDARVVLSSGFETVRVWSFAEQRELCAVPVSEGGFYQYAVCPRAELAATMQSSGEVALFSLATGEPHSVVEGPEWSAERLSFSPDGTLLAVAREKGLALWDVKERRLEPLSESMGVCASAEFSPDGALLAATTENNRVELWDLRARRATPLALQGLFPKLRFSPDGRTLALLRSDCLLVLWDLREGRVVCERPQQRRGWCGDLRYLSDGTLLLAVDRLAYALDGATGEPLGPAPEFPSSLTSVGFVREGAAVELTNERTTRRWDARSGELLATTPLPPAEPTRGPRAPEHPKAQTPDGALRAEVEPQPGKPPFALRLYAAESAEPRWSAPLKGCAVVALSPDGAAAAHALGAAVQVLDGRTGEVKTKLRAPEPATALALSPGGELLAVGDAAGTITVLRPPARAPVATFVGHLGGVSALAFREDGAALLSGGAEGNALLWELPQEAPRSSKKASKKR